MKEQLPVRKQLEKVDEAARNGYTDTLRAFDGDENPAVRDGSWARRLAIGFGTGVAISTALWLKHKQEVRREMEEIISNPLSVPPKRTRQVGDRAIKVGRGDEFLHNLFASSSCYPKEAEEFWATIDPYDSIFSWLLTEDTRQNLQTMRPRLRTECKAMLRSVEIDIRRQIGRSIVRKIYLRTPDHLRKIKTRRPNTPTTQKE